jgi:hypothetical protein
METTKEGVKVLSVLCGKKLIVALQFDELADDCGKKDFFAQRRKALPRSKTFSLRLCARSLLRISSY